MPTHLLEWKSPYEVLFQRKPNYSIFKVFGCLCFVANTNPNKHKLEIKAHKCVFLGHSSQHKGYHLLNLDTNNVIVSRDVKFYETSYPFLKSQSTSNPEPPNDDPFPHQFNSDQVSIPAPNNNLGFSSKPARTVQKPHWRQDYIFSSNNHGNALMNDYREVVHNVIFQEPQYFHQGNKIKEWQQAMKEELDALIHNQTWELTTLPQGIKPISCKWVYRIKKNPDGSIARYKARLVAKEFLQVFGKD